MDSYEDRTKPSGEPTELQSTIQGRRKLQRGDMLAGRFTIVQFLAEGGMGEVYEAADSHLQGKHYALKTLRPDFAQNSELRLRFEREVLLAREITHPNVCPTYDIFRADGPDGPVLFLTMKLLRGESLLARLKRLGRIPPDELRVIAKQMADALDAAHRGGVIHRDFKPGNVMIEPVRNDLRVSITDFGLSRAYEAETTLAQTGFIMGTPGYIAPELIQGRIASFASDVYAFGVVLYELATGIKPYVPFDGSGPERPTKVVPELPPAWDRVILGCLQIVPEKRFQSAGEAIAQLEPPEQASRHQNAPQLPQELNTTGSFPHKVLPNVRLDDGQTRWMKIGMLMLSLIVIMAGLYEIASRYPNTTATPAEQNIVILPFQAIANTATDQAYSNGLTETLTSKLTRLTSASAIQVIDANTARKVHSVQDARSELGATLVIEGTIQQERGTVRVNYTVVNSTTNKIVQSDTLTLSSDNAFMVQDRLVDSVARKLGLNAPASQPPVVAYGTQMPGAYEFYLQGMGYLRFSDKPESMDSAIKLFQRAIALDADYGLAYAGLGESYWKKYILLRDTTWVDLARNACERALALDEMSAEPHICLGDVENGLGKYERAADQFQRALAADPAEQVAYIGLARAYAKLGRDSNAETTYRQAIAVRPQYWDGYFNLGLYYNSIGQFGNAEKMFDQVVALAPDNTQGWNDLGAMYLKQAKSDSAVAAFRKSLSIRPTPGATSNLAFIYYQKTDYVRAAEAYREAVSLTPGDYRLWGNLASALDFAGQKEESQKARQRARDLAQAAVEVNPKSAQVLASLADFTAGLGDLEQARSLLVKAIALGPDDPSVLFRAALVYESPLNDRETALSYLKKAVDRGQSMDQILSSPNLKRLREDPRFKQIQRNALTK